MKNLRRMAWWGRRRDAERKEIAELRAEIAALKAEAVKRPEEAVPLANQLVESMGSILASQAQQQPQLTAALFDHVTKMMDLVRRDTARQMGREGGKKSAAGRAKKKVETQAVERLQEMAEGCLECRYNLHAVPWSQRQSSEDYQRHRDEAHDVEIEKLVKAAPAVATEHSH